MSRPPRVALIGATGYTGAEALRLLLGHPQVFISAVCAQRNAGRALEEVLPSTRGLSLPELEHYRLADLKGNTDFALLALPHGASQEIAAELLGAGIRVIDLSADHRFSDPAVYARIYGKHKRPKSLAQTVYGLPELNREAIRTAPIVGCPGCYPTGVILAASPAIEAGFLASDEIIADCKSGVSGAGREPSIATHFPETAEGVRAYKTLSHRHSPEISVALDGARVRMVPHLVPMNRGILSTVYLRLNPDTSPAEVREYYTDHCLDETFVHLLPAGLHADTRHVRGTNHCHLSLFFEDDLMVVQSAIDNLGKGAAGQAIQCLNLMAGLPETTGLLGTALYP